MHVLHRITREKGIIAIVIACALVVFLGAIAFVTDFGVALITRNQLQNISDAASLAGLRQLGKIYAGMTITAQQGYVLTGAEKSAMLAQVYEIAGKHVAGGKSISINPADIVIGQWDSTHRHLTPTEVRPDAVRVVARRDEQANGPLSTFFAGILGTDSLAVSAQAIAALTGINAVLTETLNAPFGIAREWFENHSDFCHLSLQLFPTDSSAGCVGWHTFFTTPTVSNLQSITDNLRSGTFTSPAATAKHTHFNFIAADVSSAFAEFHALYEAQASCTTTGTPCRDAPCDGQCEWPVLVGVYDAPDCTSPNTTMALAGFTTATIYEVQGLPDEGTWARVECNVVQPQARGGGANFGTKGSIPGLVQ